ncbi:phage tail tape measure protein [Patescibacteria group bacterium]|nr:phage tail tape measure protein [Patescibacteria group bacterium]
MSTSVGSLFVRLGLDATEYQKGLETAASRAASFGQGLTSLGNKMTLGVTLPIVAAGTVAVKTFMDLESAWTGVAKTMSGVSATELTAMRGEFDKLATTIPVTIEELYGIGEAAGQLGIKKENVVSFTKVMADLSATTNLGAEEAATSLSRFANITGMSQKDFDRLGATIVELGNNFATNESSIVSMSMRLAAAGDAANMSEHQIMAFATALSSLGIEAEMGGSAFSKWIKGMQTAVFTGENITEWARVAGMSVKDFSQVVKTDAAQAMNNLIKGFQNIKNSGGNLTGEIQNLIGKSYLMADVMGRLAGSGDLVTRALTSGKTAWAENVALVNEANLRYGTMSSQMTMAKNQVRLMANEFGNALAPSIISIVKEIKPWIQYLKDLDEETKTSIIKWGLFVAAIGPALKILGGLTTAVSGTITVLKVLGPGIVTVVNGLMSFGYAALGLAKTLVTSTIPAMATMAVTIAPFVVAFGAVSWAVLELIDNWDELGKTFDAIGAVIRQELSAMDNRILTWKTNIIRYASDAYDNIVYFFGQLPSMVSQYMEELYSSIVSWITKKWLTIITWTEDFVEKIIGFFEVMPGKIGGYFKEIYNSAKSWLGNKLLSVFDWVIEKIHSVSSAFGDLYDDVVGNSYVPDLVDGIAKNFSKLQKNMVDPATSAADKVSAAFSDIGPAGFESSTTNVSVYVDYSSVESATQAMARLSQEIDSVSDKLSDFNRGFSLDRIDNSLSDISDSFYATFDEITDVVKEFEESFFDKFIEGSNDVSSGMSDMNVSVLSDLQILEKELKNLSMYYSERFVDLWQSRTSALQEHSSINIPIITSLFKYLQDTIDKINPEPVEDLSDAIVDMSETAEPLDDVNVVLGTLKNTMSSWSSVMPGITSNLSNMVAQITPWTQAFGANGSFANSFDGFSTSVASQISNLKTLWIGLTGNMKTAWADAVNFINTTWTSNSSTVSPSSSARGSSSISTNSASTNVAGGIDSNALIHQLMQGLFTNSTYFSAGGSVNQIGWDPGGWGKWYQMADIGKEFRAYQTGVLDAGYYDQLHTDTRYFDAVARKEQWHVPKEDEWAGYDIVDNFFKLPYKGGRGYTQHDGISVPYSNSSTNNNFSVNINVDGMYFDNPTQKKKFINMVQEGLAQVSKNYF